MLTATSPQPRHPLYNQPKPATSHLHIMTFHRNFIFPKKSRSEKGLIPIPLRDECSPRFFGAICCVFCVGMEQPRSRCSLSSPSRRGFLFFTSSSFPPFLSLSLSSLSLPPLFPTLFLPPGPEKRNPDQVKDKIIQQILHAKNHYEVLGVGIFCPDNQKIKGNYKKLLVKVHPDKCCHSLASSAFQKVQGSYNCLR